MTALAPHTTKIFDEITTLECIKPYFLVGGTALSLQLNTRLSEDLDFMSWKTQKSQNFFAALCVKLCDLCGKISTAIAN